MTFPSFVSGEVLRAADMNAVGLWKVGTFTANGTSRALVCDNVFTTDYNNYRVVIQMRSTVATNAFFYQYIDTSGNNVNSGYYGSIYGQDFTTGATATSSASATTVQYIAWIPNSSNTPCGVSFDLHSPRLSTVTTSVVGHHSSVSSGFSYLGGNIVGMTTGTTAFRGLRFDNGGAGNLTGTVTIYGYNP
jgi:hypothetical protein